VASCSFTKSMARQTHPTRCPRCFTAFFIVVTLTGSWVTTAPPTPPIPCSSPTLTTTPITSDFWVLSFLHLLFTSFQIWIFHPLFPMPTFSYFSPHWGIMSMGYPRTSGSGFMSSRPGRHFIIIRTMTSCALRALRSPHRSGSTPYPHSAADSHLER
jgi:hypothetical protein